MKVWHLHKLSLSSLEFGVHPSADCKMVPTTYVDDCYEALRRK